MCHGHLSHTGGYTGFGQCVAMPGTSRLACSSPPFSSPALSYAAVTLQRVPRTSKKLDVEQMGIRLSRGVVLSFRQCRVAATYPRPTEIESAAAVASMNDLALHVGGTGGWAPSQSPLRPRAVSKTPTTRRPGKDGQGAMYGKSMEVLEMPRSRGQDGASIPGSAPTPGYLHRRGLDVMWKLVGIRPATATSDPDTSVSTQIQPPRTATGGLVVSRGGRRLRRQR